jgi:hypothetical protein
MRDRVDPVTLTGTDLGPFGQDEILRSYVPDPVSLPQAYRDPRASGGPEVLLARRSPLGFRSARFTITGLHGSSSKTPVEKRIPFGLHDLLRRSLYAHPLPVSSTLRKILYVQGPNPDSSQIARAIITSA